MYSQGFLNTCHLGNCETQIGDYLLCLLYTVYREHRFSKPHQMLPLDQLYLPHNIKPGILLRGVFGTPSNTYDGVFTQEQFILDVWKCSEYACVASTIYCIKWRKGWYFAIFQPTIGVFGASFQRFLISWNTLCRYKSKMHSQDLHKHLKAM